MSQNENQRPLMLQVSSTGEKIPCYLEPDELKEVRQSQKVNRGVVYPEDIAKYEMNMKDLDKIEEYKDESSTDFFFCHSRSTELRDSLISQHTLNSRDCISGRLLSMSSNNERSRTYIEPENIDEILNNPKNFKRKHQNSESISKANMASTQPKKDSSILKDSGDLLSNDFPKIEDCSDDQSNMKLTKSSSQTAGNNSSSSGLAESSAQPILISTKKDKTENIIPSNLKGFFEPVFTTKHLRKDGSTWKSDDSTNDEADGPSKSYSTVLKETKKKKKKKKNRNNKKHLVRDNVASMPSMSLHLSLSDSANQSTDSNQPAPTAEDESKALVLKNEKDSEKVDWACLFTLTNYTFTASFFYFLYWFLWAVYFTKTNPK